MLPTLTDDIPVGDKWIYEIKYDGFRCGLQWTKEEIKLISRNGKDLTKQFPEIIAACQQVHNQIADQLPLFLDGELVILRTPYQGIFSKMQQRGRLRAEAKIAEASMTRPAVVKCFDLLMVKGNSLKSTPLIERKERLAGIFDLFDGQANQLHFVHYQDNVQDLKELVFLHQCEGIIAKEKQSIYTDGLRTPNWYKIKNYRVIQGVVSGWNPTNDYIDLQVYHEEHLINLGKVKHGFQPEEKQTLIKFIQKNGEKNRSQWLIKPSICLDINCLDARDHEIREAVFKQFRFDLKPEKCTTNLVQEALAQLPEEVELTKPEKTLFPNITKLDYLLYLREIAPFLLPKLINKRLTLIRYPDGVHEGSFYQKHLPDYAPSFIASIDNSDETKSILCQNLASLLWFGNHGALEFHVPFHTIDSEDPDEMVFDLDPPSLAQFNLAVMAAHLIKDIVEDKGFKSYVKTSGQTGLQVHVPLHQNKLTFDQTRAFMKTVAEVIINQYPNYFTVERLKKNRKNRLYIDYIQHAPGKTIIAPYSTRATVEATVATPLFWEEVNEKLNPKSFTITTVPQRIIELGCPLVEHSLI